jgi:lysozyme family protein
MITFEESRAGYLAMWTRAKLLPAKRTDALAAARKIADDTHRSAFQAVEAATGVPWFLVGCLLYRESDLNLGTYLGNGQSLSHVTTVEPIGRGPWPTFLAGAVDALKHEGMTGIAPSDWTADRMLYWCERFNGQGYFGHGNSPYIWAGTDQYSGGLFVADHDYDPNAHDDRLGVAAIFKALAEIYPDIAARLASRPASPPSSPSPQETKPMPTTAPTPQIPTIQIPHIDFATIEKLIESVSFVLPIIAAFVPQAKVVLPLVPVLEQILKAADEVQQTLANGGDIWSVIASHLHTIADQVKAAPAAMNAATPSASTNGMPNS